MCGRYTLRKTEMELAAMLAVIRHVMTPRFNIAPSQQVPVCRVGPGGQLEYCEMRWGLIPHWSKDSKPGYSTINARAETVKSKPAYRTPFRRQRCLIPVDGWYEWQQTGARTKQPYFFHRSDEQLFFFAGLWDHWEGRDAEQPIDSCSIIVTQANKTVQAIHDRMPVIVKPAYYDEWLDPQSDTDRLEQLLRPYGGHDLHYYAVKLTVNNPRFDGPTCIEAM